MKIKLKYIAVSGVLAFFVSSCSFVELLNEDIYNDEYDGLYYEYDEQTQEKYDESQKYNTIIKKVLPGYGQPLRNANVIADLSEGPAVTSFLPEKNRFIMQFLVMVRTEKLLSVK